MSAILVEKFGTLALTERQVNFKKINASAKTLPPPNGGPLSLPPDLPHPPHEYLSKYPH